VIYAITINDVPAERHRYYSAHEALHEKVRAQAPPFPCEVLSHYPDVDHAAAYIFRPGEEKPYVSILVRPAVEIREEVPHE
jgi:hypothetical protein